MHFPTPMMHSRWLWFGVLVVLSLALGVFPKMYSGLGPSTLWIMGTLGAIGISLSLLAHELCHSPDPDRPETEMVEAVVGVFVSVFIGALFYAATAIALSLGWSRAVVGVLSVLGTANFAIAALNLLPALPLDGGRLLRAIVWVWKKDFASASRVASVVTSIGGVLLVVCGLVLLLRRDYLTGLWLTLFGAFLSGRKSERTALADQGQFVGMREPERRAAN